MRMGGVDKGLQTLHGEPLAAHVLKRLAPQTGALLISANRHPEVYTALGAPFGAKVRCRHPARLPRTAGGPARRPARGRHRLRAERALRHARAARRPRRPPRAGAGARTRPTSPPSRPPTPRATSRSIPCSRCCARASPTTSRPFWTPASVRFARGTRATRRSKSPLPTSARFTISIRYKNSPTSNVVEVPVEIPLRPHGNCRSRLRSRRPALHDHA